MEKITRILTSKSLYMTVLSLLLFSLFLNLIADNPWTHGIVKRLVHDSVAEQLQAELEFQSINLSVVPPSVSVFGIHLSDRQSKQKLVSAARVDGRLSLSDALLGRFKLAYLRLYELEYFFQQTIDLSDESTRPEKRVQWPPTVSLPVEMLVLENATLGIDLRFKDAPYLDLRAFGRGFNFTTEIENWDDLTADLEIQNLEFYFAGKHVLQNARISSELELEANELRGEGFRIESHDFNATCDVRFTIHTWIEKYRHIRALRLQDAFVDHLEINVAAKMEHSQISVLGRYLDIDDTYGDFRGDAALEVVIPVRQDKQVTWSTSGSFELDKGKIFGFGLYDKRGNFHLDSEGIVFKDIGLYKGNARMGGLEGQISFDQQVGFDFALDLEGVPTQEFLAGVKVPDFDVIDAKLFARQHKISGAFSPFSMQMAGPLLLRDIKAPPLGIVPERFLASADCLLPSRMTSSTQSLKLESIRMLCGHLPDQLEGVALLEQDGFSAAADNLTALETQGEFHYDAAKGMQLDFSAAELETALVSYYLQQEFRGTAATQISLTGPYEEIQVGISVDGEAIYAAGADLGSIRSEMVFHVNEGRLSTQRLIARTLKGGEIELERFSLVPGKELFIDGFIRGESIESGFIEELIHYYNPDGSQRLAFAVKSIKGRLKGPLLQPLGYRGSVIGELTGGEIGNAVLFSRLSGGLLWNDKGLSTQKMHLSLESMRTAIEASIEWQSKRGSDGEAPEWWLRMGGHKTDFLELRLVSEQRDLSGKNDLSGLPVLAPLFEKGGIRGSLAVDGEFEGSISGLRGPFRVTVKHLHFLDAATAPLVMQGVLDERRLVLNEISQAAGSLLGRLEIQLDQEGLPYNTYVRARRFDVRGLLGKYFYTDARNYAYMDGSLELEGELADFWQSRGALELEAFQMKLLRDVATGWRSLQLAAEQPVRFKLSDGRFNIEGDRPLVISGEQARFELRTQGNRVPDDLNLGLLGFVKLDMLRYFLPKSDSSGGVAKLEGLLTGSTDKPNLTLGVTHYLEDEPKEFANRGSLVNFEPFPPAFEDLRYRIRYESGVVRFDEITAKKGLVGRVSASGQIDFTTEQRLNSSVNIALRRAELRKFPLGILKFDSEVSGDMVVSGSRPPFNISGNLTVDKAHSFGDFDIRNQIINSINRRRLGGFVNTSDPNANLDLTVVSDKSIKIRNRNIVAELSADLQVRGTDAQPIVLGRVDIDNGKFFYKRDFTIRRGQIWFQAAAYPPDPRLEIVADANVTPYVVTTSITGFASEPKVDLTIDPPTRSDGSPITKVEILLLLTQGSLPERESSTLNASAESAARSEALNIALSQFEQPVERLFDLSGQTFVRQVYLDTTINDDDNPVPRINLPIHFTDNVNLILQVDNESNIKLTSEYSIHDSISLSWSVDKKQESSDETKVGSETDSGVDLKFRFSFP